MCFGWSRVYTHTHTKHSNAYLLTQAQAFSDYLTHTHTHTLTQTPLYIQMHIHTLHLINKLLHPGCVLIMEAELYVQMLGTNHCAQINCTVCDKSLPVLKKTALLPKLEKDLWSDSSLMSWWLMLIDMNRCCQTCTVCVYCIYYI